MESNLIDLGKREKGVKPHERERERDLTMKDEGIQNMNLEFQSILGQCYYCDKFRSIEGQSRVGLKIESPYEFFDQLRVDQSDPKKKKKKLVDQKVIKNVQIRKNVQHIIHTKRKKKRKRKRANNSMLEIEFNMLSVHV